MCKLFAVCREGNLLVMGGGWETTKASKGVVCVRGRWMESEGMMSREVLGACVFEKE